MMTAEQFAKALYTTCLNNGLYQPEHLARVDHHCTSHEVDEDINYYGLALEELERIVENRTFYDIAVGDFYPRSPTLDRHLEQALAAMRGAQ
jgi:hypothetical protein